MRFPSIFTLAVLALAAHCAPIDTQADSLDSIRELPHVHLADRHDKRQAITRSKAAAAKQPATKKPATRKRPPSTKTGPPKKVTQGAINKNPTTGTAGKQATATKGLGLVSLIQQYEAPTAIRMKGLSGNSRCLSAKAMERFPDFSQVPAPPPLTVTRGTMILTLASQKTYFAKSKALWDDAAASVRLANSNSMKTQFALPISAEADLTDKMMTALVQPAMHILHAMNPSTTAAVWHVEGGGGAPKPDLILRVGPNLAKAVVEIKTPAALTDDVIDTIMKNLGKYKMVRKLPQTRQNPPPNTPAVKAQSLTRGSQLFQYREERPKDLIMLEQITGQMYFNNIKYGALTNFNTWLLFERDGNDFQVTKFDGVVNGENKGMEIMLALSMKALGQKL